MRYAFDAGFDVPAGYLNTPAIGIPPAAVADEVEAAVHRWRTGADNAPDFDDPVRVSREGFARLVGVPADRVAIGGGVSPLVAPVAASLPDGAKVLTVAGEFTSVTFPFGAQEHRRVRVHEVELSALPANVPGHDLVAVSAAQSADGRVVDLAALREAAESAGVPVLLDVTQAAGWLPLELDWADWVVGGGYKWMLSPRGCAWLAVHPRALERTTPVAANWYAGEHRWESIYGMPLRLAQDARRLDTSPAWLPFVGAAAALSYLADLDREKVRSHCVGLADALLAELGLPEQGSAIVALAAENAGERLAAAGVRGSARAGKIRLGFHLYNTESDVEQVLRALR